MTGNPLTPLITDLMTASFNLSMLQVKPNWYEHLNQVETAMHAEDEKYRARAEFGWECDEGGHFGPHPLKPGETITEYDWEDETGLPLPEDMREGDYYVLELLRAFGQESDTVSGLHAMALRAAQYCRTAGTDSIDRIIRSI